MFERFRNHLGSEMSRKCHNCFTCYEPSAPPCPVWPITRPLSPSHGQHSLSLSPSLSFRQALVWVWSQLSILWERRVARGRLTGGWSVIVFREEWPGVTTLSGAGGVRVPWGPGEGCKHHTYQWHYRRTHCQTRPTGALVLWAGETPDVGNISIQSIEM